VRPPVNAWIHSLIDDAAYHWHIEVLPRISMPAGLELGAGIYLNSVRPEDAAETLRSCAPPDMPTGPPRAVVEAAKASLRRPLRVFYSYSHKDEAHRKRLETQLSLLRRQNVITDWHDRKIVAGEEWRHRDPGRARGRGHHPPPRQPRFPRLRFHLGRGAAGGDEPARIRERARHPDHSQTGRLAGDTPDAPWDPGSAARREADHDLAES
jgi:hypothetical protein